VRFTRQSRDRAHAESDDLSGRAVKMKCSACGQEDPGRSRAANAWKEGLASHA
jgi:hypothetical protein